MSGCGGNGRVDYGRARMAPGHQDVACSSILTKRTELRTLTTMCRRLNNLDRNAKLSIERGGKHSIWLEVICYYLVFM
mgnify:CR=1 FL=1